MSDVGPTDLDGIVQYFGREFVEYIFGEIPNLALKTDGAAALAVKALSELVNDAQSRNAYDEAFVVGSLFNCSESLPGSTCITTLRWSLGILEPAYVSNDDLEQQFVRLVLDFLPFAKFSGSILWSGSRAHFDTWSLVTSRAAHANPRLKEMQRLLDSDSAFRQLRGRQADSGTDRWRLGCSVRWSDGSGGGLQYMGIPSSLLRAAIQPLAATAGREDAIASAKRHLADARLLAAGSEAHLDRLVGVTGLAAPKSEIELASGISLRPVTLAARDLLFDNEYVQSILVFKWPFRYTDRVDAPGTLDAIFADGARVAAASAEASRFETAVRETQLALLLATYDDEQGPTAFLPIIDRLVVPLVQGGSARHFAQRFSRSGHLDSWSEGRLEGFRGYIAQLRQPSNLDVAFRRLASAAADRLDDGDALIDAMIALESMLGGGSDTNFRLQVSVANLLHPDDELGRDEVHRSLRAAYKARSTAVHGGSNSGTAVKDQSRVALKLGFDVLVALLAHPKLGPMKAEERSTHLVFRLTP